MNNIKKSPLDCWVNDLKNDIESGFGLKNDTRQQWRENEYRLARLAMQQYFAMMYNDMQGHGVDMYMRLCVRVS